MVRSTVTGALLDLACRRRRRRRTARPGRSTTARGGHGQRRRLDREHQLDVHELPGPERARPRWRTRPSASRCRCRGPPRCRRRPGGRSARALRAVARRPRAHLERPPAAWRRTAARRVAGHGEAHADRAHLVDDHQRRRRWRVTTLPFFTRRLPVRPAIGRRDRGVGQVQPRLLHRRLRRPARRPRRRPPGCGRRRPARASRSPSLDQAA